MESKLIDGFLGLAMLGAVAGVAWVMTGHAPNGDDTAAWVQAFGSIGAILGATGIARLQSHEQKRRDERDRRDRKQDKVDQLRANISIIQMRLKIAQSRVNTFAASLEKDDCTSVDKNLLERVSASQDAMERCDHCGSDGLAFLIERSATLLRSTVTQVQQAESSLGILGPGIRQETIRRLAMNTREAANLLAEDLLDIQRHVPLQLLPTPGS